MRSAVRLTSSTMSPSTSDLRPPVRRNVASNAYMHWKAPSSAFARYVRADSSPIAPISKEGAEERNRCPHWVAEAFDYAWLELGSKPKSNSSGVARVAYLQSGNVSGARPRERLDRSRLPGAGVA